MLSWVEHEKGFLTSGPEDSLDKSTWRFIEGFKYQNLVSWPICIFTFVN